MFTAVCSPSGLYTALHYPTNGSNSAADGPKSKVVQLKESVMIIELGRATEMTKGKISTQQEQQPFPLHKLL